VWAGKLTPQARVAVETNNCKCPDANKSSTSDLSSFDKPAW
jgi:hypothetical protein